MRIAGWVGAVLLVSGLGVFAVQNTAPSLPLLILGSRTPVLPLALWLLGAIGLLGTVLFRQDAMGGGDAKLAAMMGAWLGWKLLVLGIFFGGFWWGRWWVWWVWLWGLLPAATADALWALFGPGGGGECPLGQGLIGLYLGAFFPAG
ncbi:MAG: hypothetical protein HC812_19775 [Leptolyngbya sp. RL_3_1]|nr:hypothetical protein [Leptolyngbya sp. RL_3_1]